MVYCLRVNLHRLLRDRNADPIRIGVIGAGKFASMFLAQARHTPGMHVMGVCDLDRGRARRTLATAGWPAAAYEAGGFDEARATRACFVTTEARSLIEAEGLEVVIESTGDAIAGVRHALACIDARRHLVMVNVEADVLAGPALASRAAGAGVVYSLAYGDQPALIVEMVDWARTCGFEVVCAGKGTKYLPAYHASTPDTVWDFYGIERAQAERSGMNPKMFNSFLDGTKSAIEMAAVANAAGLTPASGGLAFPPCDTRALAQTLIPRECGGTLARSATVEVVSSLARDGSAIERDLRWGVYVTFRAPNDYVARCFSEYGLETDSSGRYACLYRPNHLIGLELGVSVASAALRHEPTGAPVALNGDVVATAKRALRAGERLDGEGGYTVWGRLMPSDEALAARGLPIGLAKDVRVNRDLESGTPIAWSDVDIDPHGPAVALRREMEAEFGSATRHDG